MNGIRKFSQIYNPSGFAGSPVGFGGETADADLRWLKYQGFATVINLRLDHEEGVDVPKSRDAAESAGLRYVHLPFSGQELDKELISRFLTIVGDSANQPVYIHCRSATRVAALWIIGRVLRDGWDFDATSEEVNAIAEKPADAIAYAGAYLRAHDG